MNQDTASVSSQKSSFSLSDYRLVTLDRARIVVRHRGLPENIQSRIDGIQQPEISEERKSDLISLTNHLYDAFPDVLEVASREDDAVELVCRALESMNRKTFAFRRKAGIVDLSYIAPISFYLRCLRLGRESETQCSAKILPS